MDILKTIILILFAIDCIALSAIILLQEGKHSRDLGQSWCCRESYWGQNRDVLWKALFVKSTKFLAILFIVLAVLNFKSICLRLRIDRKLAKHSYDDQ